MSIIIILIIIFIGLIVFSWVMYLKNNQFLEGLVIDSNKTPSFFRCPINESEYNEGLKHFKTKNIIIAGLLRNCSDNFSDIKRQLAMLTNLFNSYKILLVENDSNDDTRQQLLRMARDDSNITILGCGVNANVCRLNLPETIVHDSNAKRIRKMVRLRNIYLDYINEHSDLYSDYDFVAVWDLDITGTLYADGVGMSGYYFKTNPRIEALCANGISLVNFGLFINQVKFDPYAHQEKLGDDFRTKAQEHSWSWAIEQCQQDQVRKVGSCFNGFSIYRKRALENKTYEYSERNGKSLCEHQTLNNKLKGVYLNPYMIYCILKNR